jgi:hypothetical protein
MPTSPIDGLKARALARLIRSSQRSEDVGAQAQGRRSGTSMSFTYTHLFDGRRRRKPHAAAGVSVDRGAVGRCQRLVVARGWPGWSARARRLVSQRAKRAARGCNGAGGFGGLGSGSRSAGLRNLAVAMMILLLVDPFLDRSIGSALSVLACERAAGA